jgi:5-formyltetrahydrofolate cyclo-ligase
MNKDQLRKLYITKRKALSDVEFKQLNKAVVDNFFKGVDLSNVKVLHTFLPIEKNREVNTWLIINKIKSDFPNIKVSVPRINNQSAMIESFYYEKAEQLELNMWDIPEPKQGMPTDINDVDMVLVPLLAFDRQGNRVGYGRGFYDKFLATCPERASKVGLSLFDPVKEIEGMSNYDVPLDMAVTAEKVIKL